MKVPKGKHALPGPFPGRVVEVKDPRSLVDDKIDAKVVGEMFERGMRTLTGKDMKASFGLFFEPGDVVGIKVNPVGPPLINTHLELTRRRGRVAHRQRCPPDHIVIWDRFDYMLKDAGYTPDHFPGRPHRRPADDGREREHAGRTPAATTSASTTSTRTSSTSRRASSARASAATRTTSST